MTKQYINFDPEKGYLVGMDLFYECLICGDSVPSIIPEKSHCWCLNISMDVEYGRINVGYESKIRLYQQPRQQWNKLRNKLIKNLYPLPEQKFIAIKNCPFKIGDWVMYKSHYLVEKNNILYPLDYGEIYKGR